jgi:OFA family oxalate/formate antiporter-like MFS transporter
MDGRQGWWVVVGGFLTITITSGIAFFVLPLMIESFIEELGWSLTEISFGLTIWGLAAALFSPFLGKWIDQYGARRMMLLGTLFLFFITLLLGQVTALWHFYVLMFLAPFGSMANTYIPVAAVVARWFVRHRGIATGVVMFGVGVGGAIIPLVTSALIQNFGWRLSYTILAFVLLLALIPILLWIRNPSDDMVNLAEEDRPGDSGREGMADLNLSDALKTRTFWGVSIGDALTGTIFAIFNVHLIYYLTQDMGSDEIATRAYSTLQICVGLGTLAFGLFADRFPLRSVMIVCYLLPAFATLLLLPTSIALLVFSFAIIAGLAAGGRNALFPVALYSSFGETHMASIYGLSNSFFMLGNAIGPFLAGVLYDATGNTRIIYTCAIVGLVISTLLISVIRNERIKR